MKVCFIYSNHKHRSSQILMTLMKDIWANFLFSKILKLQRFNWKKILS